MAASIKRKITLERLYVWQLPVRFAHWLIFLSVIVLSFTGYYIGNPFISVPGAATDHFVMGTMRAIHFYTAIVFTLAVLVRIYWFFVGNRYARWTEFIPTTHARLRSFWRTFLYYSFIRREPDGYAGHNALAGASYAFIFAVYLVMIATGLALYTVDTSESSPFQVFGFLVPLFGGLQIARLIHHIGMWIVLVFMVVHIYFVFLSSIIEHIGTFDSIFSGYKFVPDEEPDDHE
ncbi:MAG TPA: Ni/Fe-hydrogenase, b-type cytochrome subunit [Rhizomicrobium sp.]|nr:Ni/Fe-hydrogenase, b-type cytochrome subunit [Rhizomicrobium sp.]